MKVNLVVVVNKQCDKVLLCYRSKDPYKGLYNFVGGKIDKDEDGYVAAYRELEEETAITKDDIILHHLMDMNYYLSKYELEVYVGRLNKDKDLIREVNELHWLDLDSNFFDLDKFAGEGIVGHIMEQLKIYSGELLDR